ncbi:hypothetical protein IPV69_22570 [Humisphaera borealis]|uniref:4Fe4S-binding SPASM domain-containing protein n=1 Tax=Humisphaera borealis TaxID=2807512 RepID=A0A7M2WWU0_9BACT|nr:hypothetical protein IPV69_22570 [Humisphaera borealis]
MTTSTSILTLVSLLHERATENSATRQFRGEPVLAWTLRRVRRCDAVGAIALLCWDDQAPAVRPIAEAAGAEVISQGARQACPAMDAVSAARRWADGWRGGPLGTSSFDAGFHPAAVKAVAEQWNAQAVLLVDPAAALVDPALLSAVITQFDAKPAAEFVFTPAATGLGAMLLPRALVDRLAAANSHPGRLLHYFPDQVSREPIAQDGCAATPTTVARSVHRYTLTSQRQIARVESATADLNGQLVGTDAESIVARMAAGAQSGVPGGDLPREVVLELTTRRDSRPIFSPAGSAATDRPDLPLDVARRLIDEMAALDDTRLTLAGVGDPLLHADCIEVIRHAAGHGIAVNVETDLLSGDGERIAALAESPADLVSIHLPALAAQTYAQVMGVDAYALALGNVQGLVSRRAALNRGTPLVIPLFTKCRQNLQEMEPWYDQWLRAVGSAVILGPSTFAGLIPDVAVADMSPPLRVPCRRLRERLAVLSDGCFTTCEQDVAGRQVQGRTGDDALSHIWQSKFAALRNLHADGRLEELAVCAKCKEWHRA